MIGSFEPCPLRVHGGRRDEGAPGGARLHLRQYVPGRSAQYAEHDLHGRSSSSRAESRHPVHEGAARRPWG